MLRFWSLAALMAFVGVRLARQRPTDDSRPHESTDKSRGATRVMWRSIAAAAALLIGVGGAVGGLTMVLGLVPIKASSGHWAITRWFLNFSMGRSVAMHAARIEPPPLEDPALVLRGAGQYEGVCRPCHGAPGMAPPPAVRFMTPQPPDLRTHLQIWSAPQLFYIVKHGVKFTGMPGWPSQHRDDEVWAMVAFLQRMPLMTPGEYRRLVAAPAAAQGGAPLDLTGASPFDPPAEVLETCARCHGADGAGRGAGAFPKLAGQRPAYLLNSLRAYAEGRRHSGIMGPIAGVLTRDRMRALADYYASASGTRSGAIRDAAVVAAGEAIAMRGIPEQDVPSCSDCHGPSTHPRNRAYPILAGQYPEYLVLQLQLFREGRRGGSPYAHLMQSFAHRLTPEQARAAAEYYASLR